MNTESNYLIGVLIGAMASFIAISVVSHVWQEYYLIEHNSDTAAIVGTYPSKLLCDEQVAKRIKYGPMPVRYTCVERN